MLLLSFLFLPILCNASPINRQVGISDNVFMTTQNGTDGLEQRVCSIDAVTYMDGETIPTSSPCEHCVCRPPGFACTITSCEYRPGCKAFRRSDQCCPEYQCECEKDGKIYQNGEKIMDSNNPCEVCYCQGGEIVCAVIDCYWRNDCAPRYIDNRCCPMYDHCPPPAAQGPIRHRLPTLSSPVPISWHNLTTTSTTTTTTTTSPPPPPPPSTEVTTTPTTTTSTSTTTTEPSTSAAPLNDEVSSSTVADVVVSSESPAPAPTEQAQTVDVNANEVPEDIAHDVGSPSIVPTTTQPELQSSLSDEDQHHDAEIVSNDENHVLQPQFFPIPTQALSVEPIIQSSSAGADASSLSSELGSTIVAQPTQIVVAATEGPVGTTSEPEPEIAHDDVSSTATTIASVPLEAAQDESVAAATQHPEVHLDATEVPVQEQGQVFQDELNILNETPVEPPCTSCTPLNVPTENTAVVNDEAVAEATTAAPVSAQDETDNELDTNERNQVRHDLPEVSTDATNVVSEIQNDQAISPTTVASIRIQNDGQLIVDDDTVMIVNDEISEGSTEKPVQAEIKTSELSTGESGNELPVHDESNDLLQPTTASSHVLQDEITTDSPSPSGISHDDETEPAEEVNNEQVVATTGRDAVIQEDAPATETIQVVNDDTTQTSQSLDHVNNIVKADDGESHAEITHDDGQDEPVTTENGISYDAPPATEAIAVSQDDIVASDDPVHVNEQPQESQPIDDNTATEKAYQAVQSDEAVARATEVASVLHHEDESSADDVILADEPVTQLIVHDDIQQVTEKVDDGEKLKTNVVNAEPVVRDAQPSTDIPLIPQKNADDQVFDIILDDEIIPSQPETLNQVRDPTMDKVTIIHAEVQNDNVASNADSAATTVKNDIVSVANDEVAPESQTAVNDETVGDVTVTPYNDEEQTTSRQFRDDIDEMIQLRHHINGMPHEDAEAAPTTTPSSTQQGRGEEVAATTSVYNEIVEDEPVVTTASPEIFNEVYKNKVQRVAETLQQFNVIAGSEETGTQNKFRLEPDIFGGGSLEIVNDATTQQAQILSDEAPVVPTTASSANVVLNDEETSTSAVEVVHEVNDDLLQDAVTEGSGLEEVHNDVEGSGATPQNDDVVLEGSGSHHDEAPLQLDTTEGSGSHHDDVPLQLDNTEGSGSHHDEAPLQLDTTEGSGQGRLDLETTVSPLSDDSETTSPQPSYSFRMELLSSIEDDVESGSGSGAVQQDTVFADVTSPQPLSDDAVAVTEKEVVVNDEIIAPTTIAPVEADAIQNDDSVVVTTASPVSRLRSGLEEDTELPLASSSVSPVEQKVNDFVEVSTSSPSGFAVEIRENDETVAATQLPVQEAEVHHDDIDATSQVHDIIPADDETATPSSIPVSNLISSDYTPSKPIQDNTIVEVVDQSEPNSVAQVIANDETVTQSAQEHEVVSHDEVATEAQPVQTIANDDVTQNPAEVSNDEPVTQGVVQDEPSGVTQAVEELVANDESEVLPTEIPNHDSPVENDNHDNTEAPVQADAVETATSHVAANDDEAVTASTGNADPVIFSDEPSPTVQPLDRLRADSSVEQDTEKGIYDDATAINNDDVSITTVNPIVETSTKNDTTTTTVPTKVLKKEAVVLPETGLPKIQPFSPDLSRNEAHELRFDFPIPPEKDNSWLSRAVNQFRRLTGFSNNNDDHTEALTLTSRPSRRTRFPSRRFQFL